MGEREREGKSYTGVEESGCSEVLIPESRFRSKRMIFCRSYTYSIDERRRHVTRLSRPASLGRYVFPRASLDGKREHARPIERESVTQTDTENARDRGSAHERERETENERQGRPLGERERDQETESYHIKKRSSGPWE